MKPAYGRRYRVHSAALLEVPAESNVQNLRKPFTVAAMEAPFYGLGNRTLAASGALPLLLVYPSEQRNHMERIDELKAKYQAALDSIMQHSVVLSHLHVQDNKLFIQGAAPSEEIKNEVWNQIKTADRSYSDLTCDLSVDASLPQPAAPEAAPAPAAAKTYTVKSGDTLSKIAKEFYGNASEYNKIYKANTGKLESPDKIKVGQELLIPA